MIRSFSSGFLLLSLLLLRPGGSRCEEGILVRAQRSPKEAAQEVLCMTPDEQQATLKKLLGSPRRGVCQCALDVLDVTFDRRLLPDLERVIADNRAARLHPRIKTLVDSMKLYEPIAVEGLVPPRPRRPTGLTSGEETPFRTVPVRLRLLNQAGRPVPRAAFQAYAEEFGICVPYQSFAKPDNSGECRLDLFPGKWTFSAAASGEGLGAYVCRTGVTIEGPTTVDLRCDKQLTLQFRHGPRPVDVDEVKVIDCGFAGFLNAPSLGPGPKGKFVLAVASDRPCTLVATRQAGSEGTAYLFHVPRLSAGSQDRLVLDAEEMATLAYTAADQGVRARRVELELSIFHTGPADAKFQGGLPLKGYVPTGEIEAQHTYETDSGFRLQFIRPAIHLAAKVEQNVVLGGPLECSVFNLYHINFAQRVQNAKPSIDYYLFVHDSSESLLNGFWKIDGKRRTPAAIQLGVRSGDRELLDSSKGKPRTSLLGSVEDVPPKLNLNDLQYRIEFPFAPGKTFEAKGHKEDYEREAEGRFKFVGPKEMTPWVAPWLKAARSIDDAISAVLPDPPTPSPGRVIALRFRPMMSTGVGALASGRGIIHPVRACLAVTHPDRALRTALRHELLHKHGIGHQDYMPILQTEASARIFPSRPGLFFVGNRSIHDSMLSSLRGATPPNPEVLAVPLLRARLGYGVFHDYVEKGRAQRERLLAEGLTQWEADCAIFDWLSERKASPLFLAAGVPFAAGNVDRGIEFLTGLTPGGDPLSKKGGPEQARVNRAFAAAQKAFDKKDREAALKYVKEALDALPAVASHRYRADLYMYLGALLFKHDCKTQAYDALKECQRTATKIGEGFVVRARGSCLRILRGEPVRTLQ